MKLDDRNKALSKYRIQEAEDSLKVSEFCLNNELYKDSINRSYYAAFYCVKAILALTTTDFKRHKDVMAYFNKTYVATGIFPKALGKRLGKIQKIREISDYDDFFLASREQAQEQYETAQELLKSVKLYICQ